MGCLNDRYAVVTGAARGIGAAIVERFLNDGVARVAMLDVDETRLCATAKELDPSGTRTFPIKCNIANPEQVKQTFASIYQNFQRIDILVNNAGITRDAIFHKMTDVQMHEVIDVCLYGTINCCRQVVPDMRARNYGKIVNISSCSVFGNPGQANYSAAKAGIIGFSNTLSKELARKGITVNCVLPGGIDTDMYAAIQKDILESSIQSLPIKRLGRPSEVAALVSFLSSDDSSYIIGQNIVCGGGNR